MRWSWIADSGGIAAQERVIGTLKVSPGRTTRNTHWQWRDLVSTARSNSSKQCAKVFVALGSKTVCKGSRDGTDGLDEQDTQKYRFLVGTALYVGQDRPNKKHNTKRKKQRDS